jgi:hypothetical protein
MPVDGGAVVDLVHALSRPSNMLTLPRNPRQSGWPDARTPLRRADLQHPALAHHRDGRPWSWLLPIVVTITQVTPPMMLTSSNWLFAQLLVQRAQRFI